MKYMYIKLRKVFVHTLLNHPVYESNKKTWLQENEDQKKRFSLLMIHYIS